MKPGVVTRLAAIGLTVADLDRAEAFFRDALGFLRAEAAPGHRTLRLGSETIDLATFDPPGQPYPAHCDAADIRFQHFAIVVRDIHAVFRLASRHPGCTPISQGGPQILPPTDGSVLAWKFRDPDGHPLELLQFPNHAATPGHALCLGIDHSAIVVADVTRSMQFYTGHLGLAVTARTLNAGPAQRQLDALAQVEVEVVGLAPPGAPTPHVELLAYRVPRPSGSAAAPLSDIAASRLVFEMDALPHHLDTFRRAGIAVEAMGDAAALIRDPDGHAIVLRAAGANPGGHGA